LLAAPLLAGCGAPAKTIPGGDGRQLLDQLSAVKDAFDEGGCFTTLQPALDSLNATVDGLPSSVGKDVQGALEQGVARLETLGIQDCKEPTPTTEETTAPTETFETVTTDETVTEETETEKTETEETETEETETAPTEGTTEEFIPPGQTKPKPTKPPKPPKGFVEGAE
jgi:hypothetical protein